MPSKFKWRKFTKRSLRKIDVKNIEDAIDLERRVNDVTSGSVELKEDNQLFVIDTQKNDLVLKGKKRGIVPQSSSRIIYWRSKEGFVDNEWKEQGLLPYEKPKLTKSEKDKIVRIAKNIQETGHKPHKKQKVSNLYDLWETEEEQPPEYLRHTKTEIKPPSSVLEKPVNTPALPIPAPGTSYNPQYEDHQDELGEAYAQVLREQEKDAKDFQWSRIITNRDKFTIEDEVQQNLESGDENEDVEDSDSEERVHVNLENVPKKTSKERRLDVEKRKRRLQEMEQEIEKKKNQDIDNINSILAEIEAAEKIKQKREMYRNLMKQKAQTEGPKKIGRVTIKPDPKYVLLSDELSKDLKRIPIGNPLRERFKSYQERSLIEPREKKSKSSRKVTWKEIMMKRQRRKRLEELMF